MSTQRPDAADRLNELFQQWKQEQGELEEFVQETTAWLNLESQPLPPKTQQSAARLRELQQKVKLHFTHEQTLGRLLADVRGSKTDEVAMICDQADRDHQLLDRRVELLIGQLENPAISPADWQAAVHEFNLIVDILELLEEQEANRIGWLRPTSPTAAAHPPNR